MIRHQMEIPELQNLLAQYENERHLAGFSGPNEVTLQTTAYLAQTTERALAEPESSTLFERRLRLRREGREGDAEAVARLRGPEPSYAELIQRRLCGTPEEIVDRIQEYKETLGITGLSLNINPGGQIPYDRVINSLRLLTEKVAPHFN